MLETLAPDAQLHDVGPPAIDGAGRIAQPWRNPGILPTIVGDAIAGSLLLVDQESGTRQSLQRLLAARGFAVTGVGSAREALAAAAETTFAYAAVEIRLCDGDGVTLVTQLRELDRAMRIVVVTDFDSFASVIVALHAGAADYLPKPIQVGDLESALLGRRPPLPPVPETPLGIDRICWEHVQRVFEQCERNVTRTANQMRMHRRTLQRILGKHAPRIRGM